MAGEWRSATVEELQRDGILRVEDGNHGEYRPRKDEFVSSGVAFIRAADMNGGIVLFGSAAKINEDARGRITKGIGEPDDILLSHKGTVGKLALVPDEAPPFVCSPQTTFWRTLDTETLDRKYLYAFLRSPGFTSQLATRAGETDMAPYVSLTSQRGFSVTLPPFPEQRAIAQILGTLDDKIELNRRRNQTLEAMVRALFQDWFVAYGPVRAKMEGREPYLPADLWQLFPDRLDEEGTPEGWEKRPLDEIADFLNGLALQKFPATDPDDSLPVIKIAELRNGVTTKSDRATRDVPVKYVINDGDFLFSWSGSLLAKFWTEGEGALNQHLFKVTSARHPIWFVSHWVQYHLEEFQAIAASKATTMGHIQRGHLTSAMTICPPDNAIKRIGVVMSPLVGQAIENELESRTLTQLRNTLLPRLISGELRIADTERFMETHL